MENEKLENEKLEKWNKVNANVPLIGIPNLTFKMDNEDYTFSVEKQDNKLILLFPVVSEPYSETVTFIINKKNYLLLENSNDAEAAIHCFGCDYLNEIYTGKEIMKYATDYALKLQNEVFFTDLVFKLKKYDWLVFFEPYKLTLTQGNRIISFKVDHDNCSDLSLISCSDPNSNEFGTVNYGCIYTQKMLSFILENIFQNKINF